MSYSVSIKVQFDAAHRLLGYKGKCYNFHGHTYCAIVEVTCATLEPPGFVVDFGVLKEAVKDWIDAHWDHAAILYEQDPLAQMLLEHGLKVYRMPSEPTAEHMAELLFYVAGQELPDSVSVTQVSIMETPTSTAMYKSASV